MLGPECGGSPTLRGVTTSEIPPMRSDIALHAAIRTALRGALGPASMRVGVTVIDGTVTLSGDVDEADDRINAACAVRRITDVRALADGIHVIHPVYANQN
jgi:osmotically-inducible protein OsmY